LYYGVEKRGKERLIYCVRKRIPELEGEIDSSNVHIYYKNLVGCAGECPSNSQLILDSKGVIGGSFFIVPILHAYNILRKKGSSLWAPRKGDLLEKLLEVHKVPSSLIFS
jgi:hypothetical protein